VTTTITTAIITARITIAITANSGADAAQTTKSPAEIPPGFLLYHSTTPPTVAEPVPLHEAAP
jgi:hypothetical protein